MTPPLMYYGNWSRQTPDPTGQAGIIETTDDGKWTTTDDDKVQTLTEP